MKETRDMTAVVFIYLTAAGMRECTIVAGLLLYP